MRVTVPVAVFRALVKTGLFLSSVSLVPPFFACTERTYIHTYIHTMCIRIHISVEHRQSKCCGKGGRGGLPPPHCLRRLVFLPALSGGSESNTHSVQQIGACVEGEERVTAAACACACACAVPRLFSAHHASPRGQSRGSLDQGAQQGRSLEPQLPGPPGSGSCAGGVQQQQQQQQQEEQEQEQEHHSRTILFLIDGGKWSSLFDPFLPTASL